MDDEGIELLKAFVEKGWQNDEFFDACRYCDRDEWEKPPHGPDCLWSKARAYLKDQGVEMEPVA